MRAALIVSAVIHLTILAAAIITLPNAAPFATQAVAALPVELVTIADETDVPDARADETAVVEDAAPETVEAETPAEPLETPGATDVPSEVIATSETARVEADESAAPDPSGAPEPVEETAEPTESEPVTQETEVAALDPEPVPEQSAEAAEPIKVPETTVPQRKPKPPVRRQQQRVDRQDDEAFNADRLSALINRTDGTGGGSGSAQASVGAAGGEQSAALTVSDIDALRSQMQRCYSPPIGLNNNEIIVVTLRMQLSVDGSIIAIQDAGRIGPDRLYAAAADAARRAVLQCQPYRLPLAKYESWKDIQVNFDPRELF